MKVNANFKIYDVVIIIIFAFFINVVYANSATSYVTPDDPPSYWYPKESVITETETARSGRSGNEDILFIQTGEPWDTTSNETVLPTLGKTFKKIDMSELEPNTINNYQVVLVVSDQVQSFYDLYRNNYDVFYNYVESGGTLLFFACFNGWQSGVLEEDLPGNVKVSGFNNGSWDLTDDVVVDLGHPIVTAEFSDNEALTDSDLDADDCDQTSFGYFSNLPENANVIFAKKGSNGQKPTMIEYKIGNGTVIASVNPWEYYYEYYNVGDYCQAPFAYKALDDVFRYAFSIAGGFKVAGIKIHNIYPEDNWNPKARPKLYKAKGDLIDIITCITNDTGSEQSGITLNLEIDSSLVESDFLYVYQRASSDEIADKEPVEINPVNYVEIDRLQYQKEIIDGKISIIIDGITIKKKEDQTWNDFVFRFKLADNLAKGAIIDAEAVVSGNQIESSSKKLSEGGEIEIIDEGNIIITNRELMYKAYAQNDDGKKEVNDLWQRMYRIAQQQRAVIYCVDKYDKDGDGDHSNAVKTVDWNWNPDNKEISWNRNKLKFDSDTSTNEVVNLIDNMLDGRDGEFKDNGFIQKLQGSDKELELLILGGDKIIPFYRVFDPTNTVLKYNSYHNASIITEKAADNNYTFSDVIFRDTDGLDEGVEEKDNSWRKGNVEFVYVGRVTGATAKNISNFLYSSSRNGTIYNSKNVIKLENNQRNCELDFFESGGIDEGYTVVTEIGSKSIDVDNINCFQEPYQNFKLTAPSFKKLEDLEAKYNPPPQTIIDKLENLEDIQYNSSNDFLQAVEDEIGVTDKNKYGGIIKWSAKLDWTISDPARWKSDFKDLFIGEAENVYDFDLMRLMCHGSTNGISGSLSGDTYFTGDNINSASEDIQNTFIHYYPAFVFDACLVGVVDDEAKTTNNNFHLLNALMSLNVRGIYAASGVTYSPGISEYNDIFTLYAYQGESFGLAATRANQEGGGSSINQKQASYHSFIMNLFGCPWAKIKTPKDLEGRKRYRTGEQKQNINIREKRQGSHTVSMTVDCSHYEVEENEFDVVSIENFNLTLVDITTPVLPYKEFEFNIPINATIDSLNVNFNTDTSLGTLDIPAYQPGDPMVPGSIGMYVECPAGMGILPQERYPYRVIQFPYYQTVIVTLFPVTFDTDTHETKLNQNIQIDIDYTSPELGIVKGFKADKDTYSIGETIIVTSTVENVSDSEQTFSATVIIEDAEGNTVETQNESGTISSGETGDIVVNLNTPTEQDNYTLRLSVSDGFNIIGESTKFINVVSGEILSFLTSSEMSQGDYGTFTFDYINYSNKEIDALYDIYIYNEDNEQVAKLLQGTVTIGAGESKSAEIQWFPPENLVSGLYRAYIAVSVNNDTFSQFSEEFSIEAGTDNCPDDPDKTEPGICGCGVPDTDSDGDGTPDCNDACPNDSTDSCDDYEEPDSDGDGTPDYLDDCPNDFNKVSPGECGCGTVDTDTDSDGTPDCNDNCPEDTDKTEPGICGCGVADTDTDADGNPDCNDNCPNTPNDDQLDADDDGIGDACDTIEEYHDDNCFIMGSASGSNLSVHKIIMLFGVTLVVAFLRKRKSSE